VARSHAIAGLVGGLGRRGIGLCGGAGRSAVLLGRALARLPRPPLRLVQIVEHVHFIGNQSIGIILLTAAFTGMVLVLQGYDALVGLGSVASLGALVSLSLIRELGPVMAALMVTARAGSAIAASMATMRVTEQIDALQAMAVDPVDYLIGPRIVAAVFCMPVLTAIFDLTGIGAGYLFSTTVLHLDGGVFIARMHQAVDVNDVAVGFWKSLAFGALVAWIASARGYFATGGAKGVGAATTHAVVIISVLILAGDYVMSALLF
jgi:phospholipid/cholesterol/gamma-HCH transport system permease protein